MPPIKGKIMRTSRSSATSAAALALLSLAAPVIAQSAPYGGYNQNGVVGSVLNSVLGGGRYGDYGTGPESMGVDRCARAAENRVNNDFRSGRFGAYRQGDDPRYNNPRYNDPRAGQPANNQAYGNQAYGFNVQYADLLFSWRVDVRGPVTDLNFRRTNGRRI